MTSFVGCLLLLLLLLMFQSNTNVRNNYRLCMCESGITVIMHAYKVFYFFTHYVRNAIILSHRPTKSNRKTIGKKSTHHLNFDMGLTIKSLTSWGEPHLNSNHSFDGSYEAKSFSVGLFFGYSVANVTIATSMKLKFVDLFLHVICCRLSTAFEMLWAKFNY